MAMTRSECGKLGWISSVKYREEKYKKLHDDYNANPKTCGFCNSNLDWNHRRNKFCNHVCAARSYVGRLTKRAHKCQNCGKTIRYKWCSKRCQRIYEFKYKREHNLPIGKSAIRGYLLLTREHKCARCKLSEWLNKSITLEAHHIDGNHNNNEEQNLELLCPNCHSITDNYKYKNLGGGRDNRRLRSSTGAVSAL